MAKYMIEGFAREVGAIGDIGHVCYTVEADNEYEARRRAYDTHEHFTRVIGWEGELIHVTKTK